MSGILSGIKVMDFGHYIAGPYAGMLLSEQGAEVIKVEPPGGDPFRSQKGFTVVNRSKKGISLDLKTPEGRKIALDLAGKADAVIENFKPGTADRLGVGYESVESINPRVVYCSISGFGRNGPYRDMPGWEMLVLSMSTLYTEQNRVGDPVYQNLLVASHYAGFMAAFYITAALYAREMSGKGELIDVSLLKSVTAMQPNIFGNSPAKIRYPFSTRGFMPLVRIYRGSDGAWFVLNAASVGFYTALCTALGHEEWLTDPIFEGAPFLILPPRSAQVASMLQSIFNTKPRDEWVDVLRKANIPCAPVQSVEQFLVHPHVEANRLLVEMEEAGIGKIKEMNMPVSLSGTPGAIKGPSPTLGQHTTEVLTGLGYSSAQLDGLRRKSVIR